MLLVELVPFVWLALVKLSEPGASVGDFIASVRYSWLDSFLRENIQTRDKTNHFKTIPPPGNIKKQANLSLNKKNSLKNTNTI